MSTDREHPMMTAREVATALHFHVNTVKHLSHSGELRGYRVCKRGDWRYDPADVEHFIQRMTKRR